MQRRLSIATFVYALMVMALSTRPIAENLDPGWPGLDKAIHAALYAGLALLVAVSLKSNFSRYREQRFMFLAFAISVGYGLLIEILQFFIPERSFDFWDMVANAMGAAIAMLLYSRHMVCHPALQETKSSSNIIQ